MEHKSKSDEKKYETYVYRGTWLNDGTFFYTDCGNRMFSVKNDPMAYHGKLCPKCLMENKIVTLFIRGSEEAQKYVPHPTPEIIAYRDDDFNAYLRSKDR